MGTTTRRQQITTATSQPKTPITDRPSIPGYGVPENNEGLLDWSHVTGRLETEKTFWVGTADMDGQPHAVPVWALWIDGALYFDAGPRSQRNLAKNPKVAIHIGTDTDVVMLEGTAEAATDPDGGLFPRFQDAMTAKYDYTPDKISLFVLNLKKAIAWSSFPDNATRWTF